MKRVAQSDNVKEMNFEKAAVIGAVKAKVERKWSSKRLALPVKRSQFAGSHHPPHSFLPSRCPNLLFAMAPKPSRCPNLLFAIWHPGATRFCGCGGPDGGAQEDEGELVRFDLYCILGIRTYLHPCFAFRPFVFSIASF